MFNFYSLYSGSSGNCSLIETDHSKVLVDAGNSAKKICDELVATEGYTLGYDIEWVEQNT